MTTTYNIRIAPRADTAANFTTANPVLALREFARETDTGRFKFGDGATAWNSLPYWSGGGYTQAEIEEFARDALGTALTADSGITITANDAGNTITIAIDGAVIDERARDAIGTALAGGEGVAVSVNDGADSITVRGGVAYPYPITSGQYHINLQNVGTLGTIATAADRFDFYALIPLANDLTLSALALYVTTGVASAKSRLGVYADNGGKPDGGALLCDSGELDCATSSTNREGAVTYTLEKGKRYWLAVLSNAGQTLRSMPAGGVPLGLTDLSGTTVPNIRRATYTYGALPSTAPTTSRTNGTQVAIGLKIA